jgi:hypothetical protein
MACMRIARGIARRTPPRIQREATVRALLLMRAADPLTRVRLSRFRRVGTLRAVIEALDSNALCTLCISVRSA